MAKLSLKDKKLIIFDLDGTLIDSSPDLSSSINFMLKELNKEAVLEETVRSWLGDGAKTLVHRALDHTKDSDKLENALEIFLNHYEKNFCINTRLYPDVKQTLQKLKSQNYTISIVTNKPFKFVEPILDKLEILGYFSFILGGDSLPLQKPDPSPLLEVCKHFNIPASQTIMIGDSKNDILAAKSANIDSIALTYGYNFNEDISICKPNKMIDNILEIFD